MLQTRPYSSECSQRAQLIIQADTSNRLSTIEINFQRSVFIPRKTESYIIIGRFSDLLPFQAAFPFIQKVALGIARNSNNGVYSSGSVQDLHLIPFSS